MAETGETEPAETAPLRLFFALWPDDATRDALNRTGKWLHQHWGGDLIGMTALPEAKLAREAEISYALVALVTDYDCWKPHAQAADRCDLLEEIIGNLKEATLNAMTLMRAAIEAFAIKPLPPSSIQTNLDLAVWTDKAKITPAVTKKYGVLLERYLKGR